MTMDRSSQADHVLVGLFVELADAQTPVYLEAAIEQASSRRQRPAWTFPERWLPMADITGSRAFVPSAPWRTVAIALLIIALFVAATVVFIGTRQTRLPAPFGPAANGLIPYAADGDIFAGDPVTGTTRVILTGEETDVEPIYSSDGTKIAFRRLVNPANEALYRLMIMNADGSDVRVVSPPINSATWWDWTPSGDLLAVAQAGLVKALMRYDGDGIEAPVVLTDDIDVDTPSLRPPVGDEIVFKGIVDRDKAGVFVIKADGSGLRELIAPTTSENLAYTLREPRYSPDGSRIAFHQWDDSAGVMRLYLVDADGMDRRELGADPGIWFTGWPVWSNDGTRIAVQRGRVSETSDGFDLPYAIIDVATGQVTETGPAPGAGRIVWAPDDTAILLLRDGPDGVTRALLLDPLGGPEREVPWGVASFPSWQRIAAP
jgi:WD40-like Beta Propeller Repeat